MYTVKQAQEILKAEPVDLFEKAHQVGDIHPNGKWVWTEIHPGKFDWRVIGGRRNKKSAAAGGSSNDSKAKTQLSGSKPSASKKTATAASTKTPASTSKGKAITMQDLPSFPDADDVSKLLDAQGCQKNDKGEYTVNVKSEGKDRGEMKLSADKVLNYMRKYTSYSPKGHMVEITPVTGKSGVKGSLDMHRAAQDIEAILGAGTSLYHYDLVGIKKIGDNTYKVVLKDTNTNHCKVSTSIKVDPNTHKLGGAYLLGSLSDSARDKLLAEGNWYDGNGKELKNKPATSASAKATAKPSSKVRGITKNADGSLTMKSPDIDSTADVSKLLDEANCSKNARGEYKVKVKSLGVNRGTMTLSPKEILSYARQYSTSGNTVTFTPVKR